MIFRSKYQIYCKVCKKYTTISYQGKHRVCRECGHKRKIGYSGIKI